MATEDLSVDLGYDVAMATYNGMKYLSEQLESINGQSLRPTCLCISDDASKDGTWDFLAKWVGGKGIASQLNRNAESLGVGGNFEKAIRSTRSGIVFLCDQDDVWLEGRALRMAKKLRESQALYVMSDAWLVDGELKIKSGLFETGNVDQACIDAIRSKDSRGFSIFLQKPRATGMASCFSRELLDWALPLPNEKIDGWVHDEWLAFCAALAGGLEVDEEKSALYRQHGGNVIGMAKQTAWSVLAKRWKHLRVGSHGKRFQQKAAFLESRLPILESRLLGSADPQQAERFAVAYDWLQYLRARGSYGANKASKQLYRQYAPYPKIGAMLDRMEGFLASQKKA